MSECASLYISPHQVSSVSGFPDFADKRLKKKPVVQQKLPNERLIIAGTVYPLTKPTCTPKKYSASCHTETDAATWLPFLANPQKEMQRTTLRFCLPHKRSCPDAPGQDQNN